MPWSTILDGRHQCRKLDPKEAMVVDIVADGLCSVFHGTFHVVVQPATSHPNENKHEDIGTQIFFEVYGKLVSCLNNILYLNKCFQIIYSSKF